MDKMIEVLKKHKIQWSITSVPNGAGGETFYAAWLVATGVYGVWNGEGTTPLEALQACIDPLMRHSRQSGYEIATRAFIEELRIDLGELSPR
jgi:hypothetical protein